MPWRTTSWSSRRKTRIAIAPIVPGTAQRALHLENRVLSVPQASGRYDRGVPYRNIDDPAKLRRLMDAVLMIEADIELPVLLRHLVEEACSLVDARYGALGVLNEARTGLEQFLTVGLSEAEEKAIGPRPTGRGVLGLLITEPETLRLSDLTSHPDSYGFPDCHPPMTSFLGVPLRSRGEVYGNLYLTDKVGADDFSQEDAALAEALALAAGIAIENTRLHDRVRVLSVLDDRDRIARDLHDRVVQRIFAVGMALQSAMRLPELGLVVDRVGKAVDDLDSTITEIRTTIFELGDATVHGGVRHGVLGLAEELTPTLGSRPEVVFDGPVDNAIWPAHCRPSPGGAARVTDQRWQTCPGHQVRGDTERQRLR